MKREGDEKGTAEQSEAKNHPVNGFLVPRAGGGTAPVPPGVPLPAPERTSRHQMAYSFCGPLCPFPPPPPDDIIAMYDELPKQRLKNK